MQRLLIVPLTMLGAAVLVAAQVPSPGAADGFEVATIKSNNSGEANTSLRRPPGGIIATNAPASMLIAIAYEAQPYQMVGGPEWLTRARFDVAARLPEGSPGTPAVFNAALRALLIQRFRLEVHWETRERPVYALTVDRADGTLGPNLKPSAIDCDGARRETAAAVREGRPAPPPPPANTADEMFCGYRNSGQRMQFGGYPLSLFVTFLANELGGMVVDRTGLAGVWRFEMKYARQRQLTAGADPTPADPDAPSIFTAVREQLGLQLEATTAPVPMLVVDRVEPPTAD